MTSAVFHAIQSSAAKLKTTPQTKWSIVFVDGKVLEGQINHISATWFELTGSEGKTYFDADKVIRLSPYV